MSETEIYMDTLLQYASKEGTIGVEEERLVRKSFTRHAYFRRLVKNKLSDTDSEFLPNTFRLWFELYDYLK